MDLLFLTPSAVPVPEIQEFREEFVSRGLKIHGSRGLRKAEDIDSWRDSAPVSTDGTTRYFFSYSPALGRIVGCMRLSPVITTDLLFLHGMNVGYSIRPSLWNRGFGTLQLQEGLHVLKDWGLTECAIAAKGGSASERVIQKCGGTLWACHDSEYIYRVPTVRGCAK